MGEKEQKTTLPAQHQTRQPGHEDDMHPQPESFARHYVGAGRMQGQVVLVTGGDSGIGRAAAIGLAKEGADVAIAYLEECDDARQTCEAIEACGRRALSIAVDVGDESACRKMVERVVGELGRLDVLINNAAEQHPRKSVLEISSGQLERTFRTNVFSMFYCTQAALPHLGDGGRIINTASVTAYLGSAHLLDYSASKGAIVTFTRSLALQLVEQGIRVNAVAPGPIWTPLIPSTFDAEEVSHFGANTPMGRPGQPDEVAPSYVFLASDASSYMTGQVIHPNGGRVLNG